MLLEYQQANARAARLRAENRELQETLDELEKQIEQAFRANEDLGWILAGH